MKLKRLITILVFAAGSSHHFAQDAETVPAESEFAAEVEVVAAVVDPGEPFSSELEADESLVLPADSPSVLAEELEPVVAVVSDATVISNLFSAYIEAMGGERLLQRIKSRVSKGTYENGDQKADFELHQSKDGGFLRVVQFPANTSRVGYDGEVAWKQAGETDWTELSAIEARKQKFFSGLNGFLNWREFYTTTRLLDDIEINSRLVKVVLAENESGVSQRIYFDAQNFRVVRVDEEAEYEGLGLVKSETYFKDYRAVDGVVVPFLEEIVLPDSVMIRRVRSVEQGVPLQAGLFSPPKAGEVASSGVRDTERFFNNLTIGGIIYTNVWVHRQTNYNVLIRHSQGIHTIKLTDLPKEDLDELRPQLGDLANIEEDRASVVVDKWGEIAGDVELQEMFRSKAKMATEMFAYVLIPFLIGWLVAHLIWSYIIKRLCDRTETKGGIACWIPFVQMAPMLRAAGFSDKWLGSAIALIVFPTLLVAIAPFVGFNVEPGSLAMMMVAVFVVIGWLIITVASLMWPFKICSRCQKSPFLGLLMFVPVANIGVVLYLAFSKES